MDYGIPGCPYAEGSKKRNVAIISLLGDSLPVLQTKCKGMFRIRTFLMLADQMLRRIEFLHGKGYIHRSIAPQKWLIGRGENTKKLYLVGFGKSKHFMKKGEHIPYSE